MNQGGNKHFGLAKRVDCVYNQRMADKIRVYSGGPVMCNGYLLEGKDGYVAVDAPEGFADWALSQMPEGAVLRHLLLTHQHFDHVQDAARLKQRTGCILHAHSRYSTALTLEDLARGSWGLPLHVQPFEVDDAMGDACKSARWGGLSWSIYHIPGHSPDSLVYEVPELGMLLTGDVLFAGSIGRTDFPGGNYQALVTGIREKLAPLDPHLRIGSGHGPESTLKEELLNNPYLT